jgi:hypothetical protein
MDLIIFEVQDPIEINTVRTGTVPIGIRKNVHYWY